MQNMSVVGQSINESAKLRMPTHQTVLHSLYSIQFAVPGAERVLVALLGQGVSDTAV